MRWSARRGSCTPRAPSSPGCGADRPWRPGGAAASTGLWWPAARSSRPSAACGTCRSTRQPTAVPSWNGSASSRSRRLRPTCGRRLVEQPQDLRPADVVVLALLAEPLDLGVGELVPAAVFEVDAGQRRCERTEGQLHLGDAGLDDVPGEDEPGGRVPREQRPPVVGLAVVPGLIDPPAGPSLDGDAHDAFLALRVGAQRPPLVELVDEHVEGVLDAAAHRRRLADGWALHRDDGHPVSRCLSVSAWAWASASTSRRATSRDEAHNSSSISRTACSPDGAPRYSRRVPSRRSVISPAFFSTVRCWLTAGRVTSNAAAISPADSSSCATSARIARRRGSAKARKASSVRSGCF